jgi:outer membrane receptor protein involved in Fe transport
MPGFSIAALLLSSVAVLPARAQTQQAAATYRFAIRDMPLEQALRSYARVTGRQIIFQPATVGTGRAPDLVGSFDADTALKILLKEVPVRVERVRPGVFVISLAAQVASSLEHSADAVSVFDEVTEPTQDIVVTGTIIRGTAPAGASVSTIDRRAIDRSTRTNVADVVALMPQNSGGTGTDAAVFAGIDRTSQNSSLASSPNLRGLGSDATLTLVDGRRQAGSGGRGDFADLSSVPLAAVERIEVLKDGASAIYGSDAVGGVVNVILKKDFRGADTRLRSGIGEGGSPANYQFNQLVGTTWNGGGVLAAFEYENRGSLASRDRASTRSADLRPFGGSDWRSFYSAPATILTYDAVAKAYVPGYAVPAYTDRPRRQDFAPGSNLENQFALTDILPEQKRHTMFLRAHQTVLPGIELFGEGRWSRRRFQYASSPSASLFVVTGANPYFVSPDGSAASIVAYSFGDDLGPSRVKGWVDAASLTGGATADLGSAWQLDTYYLFSRERSGDRMTNIINSSSLSEALGASADNPITTFSARRDGYFNPYGSGASNNSELLDFVGSGYSGSRRRSSLSTAVVKFDGPLFRLPAGLLRVALGGAWRRETLSSSGYSFVSGTVEAPTTPAAAARDLSALFGELSIPVLDETAGFGIGRLTMSAAARYEKYSDFGGTTNPKVGATWELSKALELRASWGTSFRAPALPEVFSASRVTPTQLSSASGATLPVLILSGGNPDLGPETADTLSFGIALKPFSRTRLDVGYFRTAFNDRIDRPGITNVTRALTDPTLAPFVSLIDPLNSAGDLDRVKAIAADPGAVDVAYFPLTAYRAIIDGRYVNTAKVVVEGLDVALSRSDNLFGGVISANVGAAYLFRYSQQLTSAAPVSDKSSTVGFPTKLKARTSVDWSGGPFGVTLSSTYVDSYRNTDLTPVQRVGSWLTFDLQTRAHVGGDRGFTLSMDARNLFNRSAPFVNRVGGIGYDAANADVLGRNLSVQVTKSW